MGAPQNRFQDVSFGLHIESVPYLQAKKGFGAVFLYGDEPSWVTDTGFYEVLETVPRDITGSVDPFTGAMDLSSLQVSLSATDDVIRLLMNYPEGKVRLGESDGLGGYTGDISAGQVTIDVTTGLTLEVGDYIWINNECIHINSLSQDDLVWTLGVTRGMAESPQEAHTAGTYVYTECPLGDLEPIVTLYLYDHIEESTTPIWSGFLDSATETDDNQNLIVVRASEAIQKLVDLELAATPTPFRAASNLKFREFAGEISGGLDGDIIPVQDADDIDWVNASKTEKIIRVDSFMGPFNWNAGTGKLSSGGVWIFGAEVSSSDGEPGAAVEPDTIREVLAVNRLAINGVAHNSFAGIDGGLHFAAIALSLLLSTGAGGNDPGFGTFDVLGSQWGVGLPVNLIDEDSWEAVIDEDTGQIDQLLLGYDGGFDPWEVIKELLVGNGCFLAITKAGKIALREFSALTAETPAEVMDGYQWTVLEPATIRLTRGEKKPNVKATIGNLDSGNWDADVVRAVPLKGTRRDTTTFAQSPTNYNMPWRYVGTTGRDKAQIFINNMAARRSENLPTIKCRIPYRHWSQQLQDGDYTARVMPDLGDWIRLRAPSELESGVSNLEVVGPEGTRIDINDTAILFLGRLTGYTLSLQNGSVDAEVLLENWTSGDAFPRDVAPAHRLISYDSGTDWAVIDSSWFAADGTSGFTVGDQIEIVIPSGKQWSGDPDSLTITDVDDTGPEYRVQLSADLTESVPTAFDVYIRLEDADNYSNTNWAGSSYFSGGAAARRWAFIADTDLLIGDVLQDNPDPYV